MASRFGKLRDGVRLAALRWRMGRRPDAHAGSVQRVLRYDVRITDGPEFYHLYKNIFLQRIYHFDAERPDPRILDCGSNIGMSILYFKHVYPRARVIGFEPDPAIHPYAEENLRRNRMEDVQLVRAAVGGREGNLVFYSDGKIGSCLEENLPAGNPEGWTRCEVPCLRLRDYLTEPVDFMKMNIEGAEWEALSDSERNLRQIREMIIEYHHWPGLPRTLHEILALLNRQGFEYMINDFDSQTNGAVQPPFRLNADTRYWLLIYARRI